MRAELRRTMCATPASLAASETALLTSTMSALHTPPQVIPPLPRSASVPPCPFRPRARALPLSCSSLLACTQERGRSEARRPAEDKACGRQRKTRADPARMCVRPPARTPGALSSPLTTSSVLREEIVPRRARRALGSRVTARITRPSAAASSAASNAAHRAKAWSGLMPHAPLRHQDLGGVPYCSDRTFDDVQAHVARGAEHDHRAGGRHARSLCGQDFLAGSGRDVSCPCIEFTFPHKGTP